MKPLSLGYSPCPNDTFIFYALSHGVIDPGDLKFDRPHLEDVETLNSWALDHRLDITKISCHALGHVSDEYCVLAAGGALGRGCGPLVVAASAIPVADLAGRRVAIPGRLTTAALLFKLFQPACTDLVEMRFDRIMAAVRRGEVDAGVIIHESRFTYGEEGLTCLQDLGQWWETISGQPIPLGCIVARRSLGDAVIKRVERTVAASVDYGFRFPEKCLPYIRAHSQETAPEIVENHIRLYVNDFSRHLGDEGMAAISVFLQRGRTAGVLPPGAEGQLPLFACHLGEER
ncbi:1,4-dihydroxy-6-naphthoate synthase [Desulfoprunum benzoelyticum]|uniref:1,4-dihydroxy-6-naphtoate synthase n=1 Tax=Desulfoprunum benzoelyticum TaxID=1506996 RepID=A0A840UW57_9BACT|nr:1,4-dihydroxy-6-naphthoate synthase [Desulfoprunum benzoelyticum]MBB5347644.1 1,4-dihydroxy-6-naphthoate synthase [Desulfoprunum benzoelyticum]MBM9529228.1 1,4-dihydroxy-6-naphthoate synthase [Desulfoprunum benzoelyticum]